MSAAATETAAPLKLILWVLIASSSAQAADNSISQATAVETCAVSKIHKQTATVVAAAALGLKASITNNRMFYARLALLQQLTSGYDAAFEVLKALTYHRSLAAENKAENLLRAGPAAAGAAAYAAGRIDEFISIFKQARGTDNSANACIKAPVNGEYAASLNTDCSEPDYTTYTADGVTTASIKAKQLPQRSTLDLQDTDCMLTKSNLDGYVGTHGNTVSVKWAGGLLTVRAAGDVQASDWEQNRAAISFLEKAKNAVTAVETGINAVLPASIASIADLEAELSRDPPTADVLEALKTATGESTITPGQAVSKLDAIFGKKLANGSRPFTLMVRQQAFTLQRQPAAEAKSLFDLDLQDISSLTANAIKKLRAATSCSEAATHQAAPAAACGKIEDAAKCASNADCKYDAEVQKCVSANSDKAAAKESENQEAGGKDGKATNTTGSNSFVINRAPLLLAVLLF
uniref:Variant surface glycoprotein n=1 Tax=Trypanosoma brucei TaxID=5691 RepID=A0A1V0FXY8_9TRYP|nr:variant surface glycoprotein [Trypanosoma brucei]